MAAAGSATTAPQSGLPIEFIVPTSVDPSGKVTIVFQEKPLGISFKKELPLTVSRLTPGASAEKRGVQVGWKFSKIGDQDIQGISVKDAIHVLQAESAAKLK